MKYRVTIDVAFDDEEAARKVYEAARQAFPQARSLNSMERKKISIHRCFHDETPFKPCEPIEEEVDAETDRATILP